MATKPEAAPAETNIDPEAINVQGAKAAVVQKDEAFTPSPPEADEAMPEIDIVTTAPGELRASGGIAPVGTRATMPADRVSDRWMVPATKGSTEKLKRYRAKQAKETEE